MPDTHISPDGHRSNRTSATLTQADWRSSFQSQTTGDEATIPGARNEEEAKKFCRIQLSEVKDFFVSSPDFFHLNGDFDLERQPPAKEAERKRIEESRKERIKEFDSAVQEFIQDTSVISSMRARTHLSIDTENPLLFTPDIQKITSKLSDVVNVYKFAFKLDDAPPESPTLSLVQAKDLAQNLLKEYFSESELEPRKSKKQKGREMVNRVKAKVEATCVAS